ncbi:glycerophosphoryl diester phosphodiesterase [Haloferula helveola]|uniref:Glycerophosphoryl diester phosphodiesterase n=1 Tax=Haloferula helveola TaxID=490095 RepID=A0ABM7RAZ8_9BACT|nr:glycerophosphoryl diester phosphodiesterase [Haloferula helveola]
MRISLTLAIVACLPLLSHAAEPLIVAHRGASKAAPENTLPAFRLAWKLGADAIEGDFHLTKDKRIVCIHDADTKKVSSRNLVVSRSTLAELKELDVGSFHGEKFKGTRVPTLSEVVATVPDGKQIFIEIKCGPEIVPFLLKQLEASSLRHEQIVIISFKEEVIRQVKSQSPEYEAFWLCAFKTDKEGAVKPGVDEVLQKLAAIGADGLSSNSRIAESFIEAVKAKGYQWHVWTVDDPDEARRMESLGVESITTNVPGLIRQSLTEAAGASGR